VDPDQQEQYPPTPGFGIYSDIIDGYSQFHGGLESFGTGSMLSFNIGYLMAYGINESRSTNPVTKKKVIFFLKLTWFFRLTLQEQLN